MAFDAVNAALILSKGVGIPPNDMQSFNAQSQEDGIKITMTGPKNSYVYGAENSDTLVCTPAGVMVRYSDTDYPTDINDGTLLGVYNENYDPVNPTEVTDNLIGLVFEQTYYFSAFPFSVDGIYNKSQAPANRASCQWVGNKGTINVTVATYEGYTGGEIGEYTITLVDQASSAPQNIQRTASGTGLTQIGNLDEGKTYVVTLTDVDGLTCDPSEPITIVAGETYNVTMTYREKYGTISVTVTTANDAFALGEYKITLLDQASESPQNIEKQATGKTTTVFENLIAGKQYKVRLGPATNWIAPVDSDTLTVLGGDDVAITMTYSPGLGSVVVNVTTNPTGMPIGSYTITLTPTSGGSTLSQTRSGSGSVTFNSVPIGTYTVSGSAINHYTFNANGSLSVTGGQQSSHNVQYEFSATLQDSSWNEISLISQSGNLLNFYSVGDRKTDSVMTVNGSFNSSGVFSGTTSYKNIDLILISYNAPKGSHISGSEGINGDNNRAFFFSNEIVIKLSKDGKYKSAGGGIMYYGFYESGLMKYLRNNEGNFVKNAYKYMLRMDTGSLGVRINSGEAYATTNPTDSDIYSCVNVPNASIVGMRNYLYSERDTPEFNYKQTPAYFTSSSRRALDDVYSTSSLYLEELTSVDINNLSYISVDTSGNFTTASLSKALNFPIWFCV